MNLERCFALMWPFEARRLVTEITAKRAIFQLVAIILCLKLYLVVLARNSKIKGQLICLGTEMLQGTVWKILTLVNVFGM